MVWDETAEITISWSRHVALRILEVHLHIQFLRQGARRAGVQAGHCSSCDRGNLPQNQLPKLAAIHLFTHI